MLVYKSLAALLIFLVSVGTVLYPLLSRAGNKHKETWELGEALAGGLFLGVAFFHMLPDAIRTFHTLYPGINYPISEAICIGGFLFLLLLERLSLSQSWFKPQHTIPYILVLVFILHSFIEGTALGIGLNFSETFMLFLAIIAHKGSDSFALCTTLLRNTLPLSRIIMIISVFSLMTPLGIAVGALVGGAQTQQAELFTAAFNAFAAGTFLYISTLHHIRFHQRIAEAHGLTEFFYLLVGLGVMAAIAIWF